MSETLICRELFMALYRDNRRHNHYLVLNDANYYADFWADNDADARETFYEQILKEEN